MGNDIKAFSGLMGSHLTKCGAGNENDLVVDCRESFVVYAEFFCGSRYKVLNDDVGLFNQAMNNFPAFRRLKINADTLLAAVVGQGHAGIAPVTPGITHAALFGAIRWFDLDHPGTHICQQKSAIGACDIF